MARHRRTSRVLAGGLLLVAVSACGTTVPLAAQGQSGLVSPGPLGDGLGEAGPVAPAPTTGPVNGVAPGSGSAPTQPVTGPSSAAPGAGRPTAGRVPARGPGKPVTIGMITSGNTGAFAQGLGIDINYGDQRAQAKLVADTINKRGGLLGSPIRLVFYDFDAGAGNAVNAQRACTFFTQDNHVFAVIGIAGMDDTYHACLAKAGVFVMSDADIKSSAFFRRYPTTVLISDLELVRKYRAMVKGLQQMGFFGSSPKVGIVAKDEPNDVEGVRSGMVPALKELGITASEVAYIPPDDPNAGQAAISSALLRFQSQGLTHVLFGSGQAFQFMLQAETQGYRPRYGIDSRQSPGLLLQETNSPNQLVNAYGIGYQPYQDVDNAHDPGPVSSNQTLCKKLSDDAGQGWGTNRLAGAASLYICDELFALEQVFVGQPDLGRASFLAGVATLGTRHKSTLTFSTSFSATQHDGAGSWRPLRYDRGCGCFQYVGPARPF